MALEQLTKCKLNYFAINNKLDIINKTFKRVFLKTRFFKTADVLTLEPFNESTSFFFSRKVNTFYIGEVISIKY